MRGIVYCIFFSDGKFYIGSTIQPLEVRIWEHKKYSNPANKVKRKQALYQHLRLLGWENTWVEELEVVDAPTKDDVRFVESEYIRLFKEDEDCLNECLSFNTADDIKEWRDQRRDYTNWYMRQWWAQKQALR